MPATGAVGEVLALSIDLIEPDPDNRSWGVEDDAAVLELAESLKLHGQLQPAGVRPVDGGRYRLIFGEGRYRASIAAGLVTLDCKLYQVDEVGAVELRLDENVRRQHLSPIDKLRDLARLVEHGKANGTTQGTIAKRYGLSASALSNQLRLLRLPDCWLRVISAEIVPLAWSRVLCEKWADDRLLALLDPYAAELLEQGERPLWLRRVEDFRNEVAKRLEDVTKPIAPAYSVPFVVTSKRLAELDVVEIPARWSDETQKVAFDVARWNELARESRSKKAKESAAVSTPARPSPAKESSKQRRERWERQLDRAWDVWYAGVIADHCLVLGDEFLWPLTLFAANDPWVGERRPHVVATVGIEASASDR